jgi:hypothetical protein
MTEWVIEPLASGLAFVAIPVIAWGVWQLFADVLVNRRVNNRLPRVRPDRADYLGEDYRDHVADYAAKVDRRRQIVRRTAGV